MFYMVYAGPGKTYFLVLEGLEFGSAQGVRTLYNMLSYTINWK